MVWSDNYSAEQSVGLAIWEAQVGLRWSKQVKWWNGTVYGHCGFEYQNWNFYTTYTNPLPVNGVDFYGVAVAVGITR